MFDFPKPNIIMSGSKHEETAEISFEYREFKNLIPLQNNLQEECGKQLSTSLLKTQLFRELSTYCTTSKSFSNSSICLT